MSTKKRNAKPTISIIGAGRLGTAMAIALGGAGYQILSMVGRTRSHVRKAAAMLDAPCLTLVAKELANYRPAEVVLVSVPDDRISQVSETLAQIRLPKREKPVVLHTSGALSSKVFDNLATRGWYRGSVHPLLSVSDPTVGAKAFRNSYWCLEGDVAAIRPARQIVRDLGGNSFSIKSKDKPLYHAAAVMSSGNVMALFDVAIEMLEKCGLSSRDAQKVLLPLLQSTIANLERLTPDRALTGPFSRGDLATLRLHLSALSNSKLREAPELYRLLGRRALELVEDHLSPDTVKAIKNEIR